MTRLHKQIAIWALGDDTGSSSMAIARAALGLGASPNYPFDPGDLGRCLRLLQAAPEARIGVTRLAEHSAIWKRLNRHWRKLSALAHEEGVYGWGPHGSYFSNPAAPKTNTLLRSLTQ